MLGRACVMVTSSTNAILKNSFDGHVQVILTQQPALFDRAVKKVFSKEIAEAEQSAARRASAANMQEPAAWVLQHFWDRHSALGPSPAVKPAVTSSVTQGLSRYETDFQVIAFSHVTVRAPVITSIAAPPMLTSPWRRASAA